jgi:hypothetical protein
MLDIITLQETGLILLQPQHLILPFLFLYLYYGNYPKALNFAIALICGCIYIAALKSYFKVPLHHTLAPGFAYPSGHTHVNILFWLLIARTFNNWKILILPLLYFPFGLAGIVAHNYHTWEEIFAGFISSLLNFLPYYFLWNKKNFTPLKHALFSLPLISICFYYVYLHEVKLIWITLLYSIIIGIILVSFFSKNLKAHDFDFLNVRHNLFVIIIAILLYCTIKTFFLQGFLGSVILGLLLPIVILPPLFLHKKILKK